MVQHDMISHDMISHSTLEQTDDSTESRRDR
jgi:hypothetical protein